MAAGVAIGIRSGIFAHNVRRWSQRPGERGHTRLYAGAPGNQEPED